MTELFDVVAVAIKTRSRRLLAERETKDNAEAIQKFAVVRRGVDEEFYVVEPHPAGRLTPLGAGD